MKIQSRTKITEYECTHSWCRAEPLIFRLPRHRAVCVLRPTGGLGGLNSSALLGHFRRCRPQTCTQGSCGCDQIETRKATQEEAELFVARNCKHSESAPLYFHGHRALCKYREHRNFASKRSARQSIGVCWSSDELAAELSQSLRRV